MKYNSHLICAFALAGLACSLQCSVLPAQESSSSSISPNQNQLANRGPYELSFADFDWQLNDARPVFKSSTAIGERLPTQKAIDLFLSRVGRDPYDYASRAILGELFLRQATEDDYLPAYQLAMDSLGESMRIKSNYKPAILGMARTLMAQHQFADALALVVKSISPEAQSPADLALIVDCHLDMGDLVSANSTLKRLALLEDSPPVVARLARLAELNNDRNRAIELMESALRVIQLGSADQTEWIWYQWRLAGLVFDSGDLEHAEQLVQKIIEENPNDERSSILFAKISFAKGHSEKAREVLQKVVHQHPSPPSLALIGDVFYFQGETEKAREFWDQAERLIREEAMVAKAAHAREAASFFADHDRHLEEALELILIDRKQRQDLQTCDSHAWILFKNKRLTEAKAISTEALEHGANDLMCLYHATKIHQSIGEDEIAKKHLQRIIDVNPRFSILHTADVAKLQEEWNLLPRR